MNEATKKILGYTVPIGLFIALLVGVYYLMKNSPLGKALSDILGGAGAVAAAVGQQFKTCGNVGFFNVKKGCYIGIGAVIYGVLSVFASVMSYLTSRNNGKTIVDKTATELNKSKAEVVDNVLDKSNIDEIGDSNASDSVQQAAYEKLINKVATEDRLNAVDKQGKSEEEITAEKETMKQDLIDANIQTDNSNDLNPKESDDSQDLADAAAVDGF